MKNFKFLFIALLATAAMTMSACAKKDSEFAARYAKNKLGASVADGPKTQEAGERAEAQGLLADVVDIQRYFTPEGQPGPRVVMAKILINNQEMPVTTHHWGTETVEGRVDVAGFTVVFHAMCGTVDCQPYYASMEIYKNNQMVIQEGVRKYFDERAADGDRYQWFTPEKALPLMGSDSMDPRGMVGFLNSSGNSTSSEIK
ncbi:hypothetical protein [uncultured Bdellovibrio sp.]|uniref:hypothetical protein n=1 Tax=Bdellovibrio sp. HCB-162 TaxID=3394234 RepID=UPI0025CD6895|nr:hypothetical protein [uncultured Bdellovibrio sp.]